VNTHKGKLPVISI